jgi:type IV pilus assembly protein PilA
MKKVAILVVLGCLAAATAATEEPTRDVKALEACAVGLMRTLNTAEVAYETTYFDRGFACSLDPMTAGPKGTAATADHANLIDATVKDDQARMYHFEVHCVGAKPGKDYRSTATPLVKGARAFCSDKSAVIRFAADGKAETCLAKGEMLH